MQDTTVLFEKRATEFGRYWTSSMSKKALTHLLRGFARTSFKSAADDRRFWETDDELRAYLRNHDWSKQASLGGDEESGFESSFSSLAYAYIKDKAPRLLDYIVGFQLVDRNEDSTKAMGVFGFKVGETWLYVPVFFVNGDLKGHELLWIKKQDTFVPLKENWVNYLISRKPHTLGKGSDKSTFELGGLMPNLMRIARPPLGSKFGSAQPAAALPIDEWAAPFMPLAAAAMTKAASALYDSSKPGAKLAFDKLVAQPYKAAMVETAARLDMGAFFRDVPGLLPLAQKMAASYPLVKEGFDKFYGQTFLADLTKEAESVVGHAKQANSFLVPPPKSRGRTQKGTRFTLDLADEQQASSKEAEIEVYALDVDNDVPITVNKPELTEEERKKLLRDTVLIKDKRDPHGDKASIAYNTQVRLEMVNPSDTGLYDILEKPGSFDQMLVVSSPHSGRGSENFNVIVRKSDPRSWLNAHRTGVWSKSNDCPDRSEYVKWVKGLSGVESLKKGGTYMALCESGSGTCPFTVTESYGDGQYKVRWHDRAKMNYDKLQTTPKSERPQDWEVGYSAWSAKVFINQRKGSKLRSVNGELYIPDNFKILTISPPPKPKKPKDSFDSLGCFPGGCSSDENGDEGSEKKPINPGNMADLQIMLYKQASPLKIHDIGTEVWIGKDGQPAERMAKKAALIHLVRDHGLREDQARHMLKEAAAEIVHNRAVTFLVKYAYGYGGYDLRGGPGAPAFPQPEMGVEQMGPNAVPSIYPQEEYQPVDGMSSQQTDPSVYDPFYTPDPKAMQQAQQASASGQKEVFDTSMIAGMLKAVRQTSIVDRYLGDLMKAVDKLGRLILMFHWHNEDFEDRYGKQDLPELEDGLVNNFEGLGDLTLFLKKKTVKGQTGIDVDSGSGVGTSEPNIEETAKN